MNMRSNLADQATQIGYAIAEKSGRAGHSGRNAALDMMDHVRSSGRQMRHVLLDTRDGTLRYIRHEPVKTVILVAAVGAVALGIAALVGHLRRRD
jgi:hypothetical protein